MGPMADALRKEGIATWNIEYRRLKQPGGGWPGTYLDVGQAVDHLRALADKYPLDLARVVVVGHSAGAHLAMWTGIRLKLQKSSPLFMPNPLTVRGIVNLAGRIDMTEGIREYEATCEGEPVVTNLLGGTPEQVPQRYADTSANKHVPLGVPQALIWGVHEEYVPARFAEGYMHAARKAGDRVQMITVAGVGHFETASPFSTAWPAVRKTIRDLLK
jgi:acetyl esterase/lipase